MLLYVTYMLKPESVIGADVRRLLVFFKMNPVFFSVFIVTMAYMFILLLLTIVRFVRSLRINLLSGEKRNIIMILVGFIPTSFALLFSYFLFLPLQSGIYIYLAISSFYTVYFIALLFSFGYVDRIAAVRTLLTYPLLLVIIFTLFKYGLIELNLSLAEGFGIDLQIILLAELLVLILFLQPVVKFFESRLFRAGAAASGDFHRLLKESAGRLSGSSRSESFRAFLRISFGIS